MKVGKGKTLNQIKLQLFRLDLEKKQKADSIFQVKIIH